METTTDYTRAVKAADFKPRSQAQSGQDFDFTFRK
jgi:hypothetical protein